MVDRYRLRIAPAAKDLLVIDKASDGDFVLHSDFAELEAENARLVDLIRWAHNTLYEINPSNYDHDEVCKLNDASVEVILRLAHHLGESHGKTDAWWQDYLASSSVPRTEALSRTGTVKVKALAQHDMDNGYRQTPLYGRPAHELSGNTGELIDKMAEAIRGDTTSNDTPWATLSEDRKIGWRGDAERALAVVKEYLTARSPSEQAVTEAMARRSTRPGGRT